MRYVGAAVGSLAIAGAYLFGVMLPLLMAFMGDCALSDAQYAAGETCDRPHHLLFLPACIAAVAGLAGIEWAFLRWALKRRQ